MVTPLPRLPTLHCYSQRVIIEPRRLKAQHRFFFFCLSSSFLIMIVIICSFYGQWLICKSTALLSEQFFWSVPSAEKLLPSCSQQEGTFANKTL